MAATSRLLCKTKIFRLQVALGCGIIRGVLGTEKKMKKQMMIAAVAFDACADTETIGDYTWTQRINGGVLENMV